MARNIESPKPMNMNTALHRICPKPTVDDQPLWQFLGDNNVTYGDRHDYVRVSFDTNGTCGQYELLRIKHIRDGHVVDQWTVNISDDRFRPGRPGKHRPDITKGGYYWSHDNRFYCWEPVHVDYMVQEILDFTGVLDRVTR